MPSLSCKKTLRAQLAVRRPDLTGLQKRCRTFVVVLDTPFSLIQSDSEVVIEVVAE